MKQADARRIFMCSIAALILVATWWTWKAVAKQDDEVLTPQAATKEKLSRSGLGIVAFLNDELALKVEPPESVFRSRDQTDSTRALTQSRGVRSSDVVKPSKPATFSLTYKGTFQRTDGKVVALIDDTKSQHDRFYATGEEVCGFKVCNITPKTLTIEDSDGRTFRLRLRNPKTFEEGKHGDN